MGRLNERGRQLSQADDDLAKLAAIRVGVAPTCFGFVRTIQIDRGANTIRAVAIAGAGAPYPDCNAGYPPAMPPDFVPGMKQ
jgi:hypothetical protein